MIRAFNTLQTREYITKEIWGRDFYPQRERCRLADTTLATLLPASEDWDEAEKLLTLYNSAGKSIYKRKTELRENIVRYREFEHEFLNRRGNQNKQYGHIRIYETLYELFSMQDCEFMFDMLTYEYKFIKLLIARAERQCGSATEFYRAVVKREDDRDTADEVAGDGGL